VPDEEYPTFVSNTVYNGKIEKITITPEEAVVEFADGAKFEYATDKEFLRRLKRDGYTLLKRRRLG
jgi:hypothetical protein